MLWIKNSEPSTVDQKEYNANASACDAEFFCALLLYRYKKGSAVMQPILCHVEKDY